MQQNTKFGKSVAFSYTNNELSKKEIKKIITFTIVAIKNNVPNNKFNQGGK